MQPRLLKIYASFRNIFLLLFLFLNIEDLFAQDTTHPVFTVVHLPRKVGYNKKKLNTEIASATNKEAVKKILKLKNFPAATIIIQIQKDEDHSSWWTINTTTKYDREEDNIILQSRNSTSTKFYKLSGFKSLFKDTLALLDTLSIELFIHDEDYPDDQYLISYTCKTQSPFEEKIPLLGWKLIVAPDILKNCNEKIATVKIINNNNPSRILASCNLTFFSQEQKDAILALAFFYRNSHPESKIKDIANFIASYSSKEFGTPFFPQLIEWLTKNLKPENNGDIN